MENGEKGKAEDKSVLSNHLRVADFHLKAIMVFDAGAFFLYITGTVATGSFVTR